MKFALLIGCCLIMVPERVRVEGAPDGEAYRAGTLVSGRLERMSTAAVETDEPRLSSAAAQRAPKTVAKLEPRTASERTSGAPELSPELPTLPVVDESRLAPVEIAMLLPLLSDEPPSTATSVGSQTAAAMRPPAGSELSSAAPANPPVDENQIAPVDVTIITPPPRPASFDNGAVAAMELQRPVDIEQIVESELRSLRTPQLHEPGLAVGGAPTLAGRIEEMQVTLPPPLRLSDVERAALLTEGPSKMLVRIGGATLGHVAFQMTGAQTIDIQLAGLLDLLADRFDSSEFERLRDSAAADAFVSFDQLRAIGLNLRYDPIYDELRITS